MASRKYVWPFVNRVLSCIVIVLFATACKESNKRDISSGLQPGASPQSSNFQPSESTTCIKPFLVEPNARHTLDSIVPGESVEADVLTLLGSPNEKQEWGGISYWLYTSQNFNFTIRFIDKYVVSRDDPRRRLGEIVFRYGIPNQIYWRLPIVDYDESIPRTYLLYPEYGALFIAEEQVIEFSSSTLFRESFIVKPSEFENLLDEQGVLGEIEYDRYIQIRWPCAGE